MIKEFNKINLKLGLYGDVQFFDAVDRNDLILPEFSNKYNPQIDSIGIKHNALGALACMKSHLGVYEMAIKNNWDMIFVCEDDIYLCPDFKDRMDYIESICNNKNGRLSFDLFSLGGHYGTIKPGSLDGCAHDTIWTRIYRTQLLNGSYGYIITKPVMEFILRNATYNFGADQILNEVYKRFNCYAFLPFLIGHRRGKSEITGTEHYYECADWYYEDCGVHINKPYKNHLITLEDRLKREQDERREEYLKSQR